MFHKSPDPVSKSASHRYPLAREFSHAERRITVHLADDLFEVAGWKLPDRVAQHPERPCRQKLVAFMHGVVAVTHCSLAEQLRLPEVRIPPGAFDPAAHHEVAARH